MRNLRILGLALALLVGVRCTAGDMPLATQGGGDSGGVTPADSTVPPADSSGTPDKSNLLLCQVQKYAVTTAVIGPGGGQINVGNHSLRIPANALLGDVSITAEQVEGSVSSVRLSPEGLRFLVPAELTLSYNNCASVGASKRIVYTDEMLNILELTPSLDITSSSQVRGLINHFSRYAVAY